MSKIQKFQKLYYTQKMCMLNTHDSGGNGLAVQMAFLEAICDVIKDKW